MKENLINSFNTVFKITKNIYVFASFTLNINLTLRNIQFRIYSTTQKKIKIN